MQDIRSSGPIRGMIVLHPHIVFQPFLTEDFSSAAAFVWARQLKVKLRL